MARQNSEKEPLKLFQFHDEDVGIQQGSVCIRDGREREGCLERLTSIMMKGTHSMLRQGTLRCQTKHGMLRSDWLEMASLLVEGVSDWLLGLKKTCFILIMKKDCS